MNPDKWNERAAVMEQLARTQREVAATLFGIGDPTGADMLSALARSNEATAAMCREWAAENVALMTGGVR